MTAVTSMEDPPGFIRKGVLVEVWQTIADIYTCVNLCCPLPACHQGCLSQWVWQALNGDDVSQLPYSDVLAQVKAAARPLTIRFGVARRDNASPQVSPLICMQSLLACILLMTRH